MYKILIVRKGHTGGGIERASSMMANYFSQQQEVVVLSLYGGDRGCVFPLNDNISHVQPLNKEPQNRILRFLATISNLRKYIKKIRPDVILSYGEYLNAPVLIAVRGLRIPVIISDRLSPDFSLGGFYELLKKCTYRLADGCIAQTEIAREKLLQKIKMRDIKVIPNPVNVIEHVDCEKKNIIVTVGRISPEKGQEYLLEAFSKISDKSWNLSIVGGYKNKKYYNRLLDKIETLGVQDRVIVHGRLSDFSLQLSEAKIFVLPSLSEGYPNALIEAMSVPLPCISTDCVAGPRDIIEDGINGLLVPIKDVDALYRAIIKLIGNQSLRDRLAQNAFKIRETLSKDVVAQSYLDYVLSFVKKNI